MQSQPYAHLWSSCTANTIHPACIYYIMPFTFSLLPFAFRLSPFQPCHQQQPNLNVYQQKLLLLCALFLSWASTFRLDATIVFCNLFTLSLCYSHSKVLKGYSNSLRQWLKFLSPTLKWKLHHPLGRDVRHEHHFSPDTHILVTQRKAQMSHIRGKSSLGTEDVFGSSYMIVLYCQSFSLGYVMLLVFYRPQTILWLRVGVDESD